MGKTESSSTATNRINSVSLVRNFVTCLYYIFSFSDPGEISPGESIKNEKGKSIGKFRNKEGLYGLGLLRIGEVAGPLTVTNKEGQSVSLSTQVPSWWPDPS